ncbi:uncharacterized protein (DUF2235 family) [Parvularcula dongshanensis]|uniref:Uncharacterized protein (DUF2235 family) n=1 Tax=Parvularcula dongshanensis TaxID=1173995 RepID=A0A840HZV8_9PROT|nr:uncharacterized protein (DUF2235 family) [Parvularcula dongshanensis]
MRRALERLGGGVFGHGLLGNLVEAYKFLVFNFEPEDQIFVFGFSRGAFSARSFVGLLHSAGILRRSHVEKAHQAVENYRDLDPESDADVETMRQFRFQYARETYVDEADHLWRYDVHADRYDPDACTRLRVAYLGVWDTVGSMGLPSQLGDFSDWVNERYAFHDCKLTDFVRYARHAVAIDEDRPNFAPTLWTNVEDMNRQAGKTTRRTALRAAVVPGRPRLGRRGWRYQRPVGRRAALGAGRRAGKRPDDRHR